MEPTQSMSVYWIIPFALMLLSVALFPLLAPRVWEKNSQKALITLLISLPTTLYLTQGHPLTLLHSLHEYISFISLLTTLFIISGGIHLAGDIEATPRTNTLFLIVGAVLANVVGTTGASMLLIRPLLKTNSERKHTRHIPIFFIFIVSNIGGLLTPVADPPLFLGYLRGVPFFWTLHLLPIWLVCVGILLTVFYFWDRRAHRQETKMALQKDQAQITPLKIQGLFNLPLLLGVVGCVFLPSPYREIAMGILALVSFKWTPAAIHQKNRFSFTPILEVAILFIGIFITMIPALNYLFSHGSSMGISQPSQFFWSTGFLSSFLDNAPTYLAFISMAQGLQMPDASIIGITPSILIAISAGAVLMGANTYIGNGPNFMVKALAEEAGIKMPSFLGYMLYSGGILLPLFALINWIFFSS